MKIFTIYFLKIVCGTRFHTQHFQSNYHSTHYIGTKVKPKRNTVEVDDIYYPVRTLLKYKAAGVDVTGLKVADGMTTDSIMRGLMVSDEWRDMDGDGLIGADY